MESPESRCTLTWLTGHALFNAFSKMRPISHGASILSCAAQRAGQQGAAESQTAGWTVVIASTIVSDPNSSSAGDDGCDETFGGL